MPVVCNKCLFFVEKPYRRWYNPFVQFFSEMKGQFFNISTFSSKAQLSTFRGSLSLSARKCLIITVLFSPTKKGGICNPFYWMLVCYAHPQFFYLGHISIIPPSQTSPFLLRIFPRGSLLPLTALLTLSPNSSLIPLARCSSVYHDPLATYDPLFLIVRQVVIIRSGMLWLSRTSFLKLFLSLTLNNSSQPSIFFWSLWLHLSL